jgi:hypothetical protein
LNRDRPISIGDLLRAVDSLGASDHATRQLVASMLGFEWADDDADAAKSEDSAGLNIAANAAEVSPLPQKPVEAVQGPSEAVDAEPHQAPDEDEDKAWIEPLPPKSIRMPKWFGEVKALPAPATEELNDPPPIDPLFRPDWTRALIYNAIATLDNNGPLDIDRTIELLSHGEPITEYPRLPRLRLNAVVQVLIDTGKSMAPYREDQRAILKDIKRVATELMVKEVYFDGCPTRKEVFYADAAAIAASDDDDDDKRWRVYEPPRPGTIVLALTDLGADRLIPGVERVTSDEWLAFSDRVSKAGCTFVVLTPYPQSQIPPALRRSIATITWDRATTTGIVRRSRRGANRWSLR